MNEIVGMIIQQQQQQQQKRTQLRQVNKVCIYNNNKSRKIGW